jgi:hypothetical protein
LRGPLRDVDAERAQFAVNSRRAPQGIRGRDVANEGADLRINLATAMMAAAIGASSGGGANRDASE